MAVNVSPPPQRLTLVTWLIVAVAALGFAFDIYELLMMPLIARPALAELLKVDLNTDSGHNAVLRWTGYIMWGSAICGGVFGMLGGYLTDLFGRRRVLVWSILLYAFSALAAGFSTSATMLLILRCTTFIGVCVEFVAAVAWLAELFPNPKQRETVLGWTQAFSSLGGIMVTVAYLLILQLVKGQMLPPIHGEIVAWRYTLISGVIPALPLLIIRPFLPESPAWALKRAQGTLRRPSFLELFQPRFFRTSIVTAILVACGYGCAFGAIQMTPQIVPGLDPDLPKLVAFRKGYEASGSEEGLAKLEKELEEQKAELAQAEAKPGNPAIPTLKGRVDGMTRGLGRAKGILSEASSKGYAAAASTETLNKLKEEVDTLSGTVQKAEAEKPAAVGTTSLRSRLDRLSRAFDRASLIALAPDPSTVDAKREEWKTELDQAQAKRDEWKDQIEELQTKQEELAGGVQSFQEIGGLVGRCGLAILAMLIVSRRLLLWIFLIPGMLLIPLVYLFPAAGNMGASSLWMLRFGMFVAGFFTVAQFSFWGNYLPRVYPVHLRGTGESFAANVGGRMFGTSGNALNTFLLAPFILSAMPGLARPASIAYAAAAIAFGVYLLGFVVSFFLPEPKEGME